MSAFNKLKTKYWYMYLKNLVMLANFSSKTISVSEKING